MAIEQEIMLLLTIPYGPNPPPMRSQLVAIFAYLEVLRCFNTAYDEKIDDEQELRDASDGKLEQFYKDFCVCEKNEWINKNPDRIGKISANQLRKLRNSLAHFFSNADLQLVPIRDDKTIDLERKSKNQIRFFTPRDLFEIAAGAGKLLLEKWDRDCRSEIASRGDDFTGRIHCVKNLVEKKASTILKL